MPVRNANAVARNIIGYGGGFLKTVNKTMKEVRIILDKKVTDNISGKLTPQDLKQLDHPYARRHGPKGIRVSDPYYVVNRQTGRLIASKRSGTVNASFSGTQLNASAYVGLDERDAKYVEYVIYGTSKMIPRPVLEGSLQEVAPGALTHLESVLRNFTIRFRSI